MRIADEAHIANILEMIMIEERVFYCGRMISEWSVVHRYCLELHYGAIIRPVTHAEK